MKTLICSTIMKTELKQQYSLQTRSRDHTQQTSSPTRTTPLISRLKSPHETANKTVKRKRV